MGKTTDIATDAFRDLVDILRQKHGPTVSGDLSLQDLIDRERLHPAIVRRVDDVRTVLEV